MISYYQMVNSFKSERINSFFIWLVQWLWHWTNILINFISSSSVASGINITGCMPLSGNSGLPSSFALFANNGQPSFSSFAVRSQFLSPDLPFESTFLSISLLLCCIDLSFSFAFSSISIDDRLAHIIQCFTSLLHYVCVLFSMFYSKFHDFSVLLDCRFALFSPH